MSGQHIGDLASSFVEMAKAYEELPKVKAELAEANRAFNHASDTIQRLELKLIDRNTTIDELHAKVREAEVARDDAELRFLEADEKLGNVAKALQAAGESVGLALRKPEPVADASAASKEEPVVERPLDAGTTSEKLSSKPSTGQSETLPLSPPLPDTPPSTGSESLQQGGGSTQGEPIAPEPFSPESKPTDLVEVREELPPTLADVASTADTHSTGAMPETAAPSEAVPTASGQSDPLPTVASLIDASTAGSTNANPSGDANSPIDEPSYANEPKNRWTLEWSEWAQRMDAKYGTYRWPVRTTVV